MIKKTAMASGKKVKVTFELPANGAESVSVVGDFNSWDKDATQLKKRKKDSVFTGSINLPVGQQYQFRYWIDGARWENDWAAATQNARSCRVIYNNSETPCLCG